MFVKKPSLTKILIDLGGLFHLKNNGAFEFPRFSTICGQMRTSFGGLGETFTVCKLCQLCQLFLLKINGRTWQIINTSNGRTWQNLSTAMTKLQELRFYELRSLHAQLKTQHYRVCFHNLGNSNGH